MVRDHLGRYTYAELENGQFLEVLPGKYTFFMDHESRRRRAQTKIHTGPSRSGDIEMSLVVGMHGPGDVHVLLVG